MHTVEGGRVRATGIHYYSNDDCKVPRRGPRAGGAARTQGNTQGRARGGTIFPRCPTSVDTGEK